MTQGEQESEPVTETIGATDAESAGPAETTGPPETTTSATSRRAFLASTIAAGIGGIGVGAAVGAGITSAVDDTAETRFDALDPRSEPGFDHVVTVMFENRSFDNILGMLYTADEIEGGVVFDGLADKSFTNTAPDGRTATTHVYSGETDEIMRHPQPDPGEHYPHVNTQLFGVIDPPTNAELFAHEIAEPFNAPAPGQEPDMSGFLTDYIVNFRELKDGAEPVEEDYRVAMGGFSPEMLPVFSTIARGFAVFDRWFSGAPTQTFPNRTFFHASTSHGFVTNKNHGGYDKWIDAPAAPTVFNRLQDAGLSWRVYYDAQQMVSFTGVLHASVLQPFWKSNFRSMEQFHDDAAKGHLPAYSFIEPRMIFNHNDMHPPWGTLREGEFGGEKVYNSALSDVRAGEALLHSIYSSIRGSRNETGSNALNTALLITFDEHGGTFDHVPPPTAVPPTRQVVEGEMGFRFDRLGPRVPSILVSAYTDEQTVVHDQLHHGSLIATLNRLHGLAPLTRRDAEANTVFGAINRSSPRQPYTWPTTHPQFVPSNPESVPAPMHEHKHRPLSTPARGLLGLLLARFAPEVPVPETFGEAYEVLVAHGEGLFGTRD